MTDVYRDSMLPLNELDVADLFGRHGYSTLTPARFRELLVDVVAKVLDRQAREQVRAFERAIYRDPPVDHGLGRIDGPGVEWDGQAMHRFWTAETRADAEQALTDAGHEPDPF